MAEPEHAAETTVAALAERMESDRKPMHRFNDSALSPHPRLCLQALALLGWSVGRVACYKRL